MTQDNSLAVLRILNVFNRPNDYPHSVVVRWQFVYPGGQIVNDRAVKLFFTTDEAEAYIERFWPELTRVSAGPEPEATHLWGSWVMIIVQGWNDHTLPPERVGAAYYRELPDGRDITVYTLVGGEARVCISMIGSGGIDDAYYYEALGLALLAASSWSGDGDPTVGWYRHLGSGRRREHGDPSKETVRP